MKASQLYPKLSHRIRHRAEVLQADDRAREHGGHCSLGDADMKPLYAWVDRLFWVAVVVFVVALALIVIVA